MFWNLLQWNNVIQEVPDSVGNQLSSLTPPFPLHEGIGDYHCPMIYTWLFTGLVNSITTKFYHECVWNHMDLRNHAFLSCRISSYRRPNHDGSTGRGQTWSDRCSGGSGEFGSLRPSFSAHREATPANKGEEKLLAGVCQAITVVTFQRIGHGFMSPPPPTSFARRQHSFGLDSLAELVCIVASSIKEIKDKTQNFLLEEHLSSQTILPTLASLGI